MVFSSVIFLFAFLPITLGIYYLIDKKFRNGWLLLASLFFYYWGEPKFINIMLSSIGINYLFGLIIYYSNKSKMEKIALLSVILAILANLGLLFYFKYLDFTILSYNTIFKTNIAFRKIVLPIGISFFTFKGLSYIVDLYWQKINVQKNPLKLALYISLFPQLLAGPISRYSDIGNQIDNRNCDIDKFSQGIKRFVFGLSKKAIIANNIGLVADSIFSLNVYNADIYTVWLGVICYTIQIYFDFSGYSDMAIGLGKMFGFEFMENFDYPYISKSITEFWRRWHISLSSFFRDYVYIPLGGNRKGNVYFNLIIVFICTGVWHGASWNFVVWGLWHGLFILIEHIIKNHKLNYIRVPNFIKRLYTLLIVAIGWVLFRIENLGEALLYIKAMFGFIKPYDVSFTLLYYLDKMSAFILLISIFTSAPIYRYFSDMNKKMSIRIGQRFSDTVELSYITLLLLVSCMFIITSTYNSFIYFRF